MLQMVPQYATDSFDPHVKLLGSSYVFPNTSDTWSQEMLIIRMGVVEVGNVRISMISMDDVKT